MVDESGPRDNYLGLRSTPADTVGRIRPPARVTVRRRLSSCQGELPTGERGDPAVHRLLALQAALQAFEAILLRGAVYVACPVSSGRRELALMIDLALFDRDELRARHADRWRREVLEPNKADAAYAVSSARGRHAHQTVINPSAFELDGLTQPDYDSLCSDIIRAHVGHVVLADGWQYSRGARIEAVQAVGQGLSVEDGNGKRLAGEEILASITDAVPALVDSGVPRDVARRLLPDVADDSRAASAVQSGHAAECMAWSSSRSAPSMSDSSHKSVNVALATRASSAESSSPRQMA